MHKYDLTLFDGHPIIVDGSNIILIDTGSPQTLHTLGTLDFNGRTFNTATDMTGVSVGMISKLLGMQITTLMGTDILAEFVVQFDYASSTLTFSPDWPTEGKLFDLKFVKGLPVFDAEVGGQSVPVILDSGAKLSYAPTSITASHDMAGLVEDFHPAIGQFKTQTHHVQTCMSDWTVEVLYGNLPDVMAMLLASLGIEVVLGSDFFKAFVVTVDLGAGKLFLNRTA
jgi:hypothetical protein